MKKLQRIFYYIKRNWQKLFCYGLIMMGILLFMVVLIVKPQKTNNAYLYESKSKSQKRVSSFPLIQHIKVNQDNVYGLFLYFGDDDINKYPYRIVLKDTNNKEYFNHKFNRDYESNIVYMEFPVIRNSKGTEFILTIDCEECSNVKLEYKKSSEDGSYMENSDKILGVSLNYYQKNNSFYWYSILSITIGLILLPLAKEENHEK